MSIPAPGGPTTGQALLSGAQWTAQSEVSCGVDLESAGFISYAHGCLVGGGGSSCLHSGVVRRFLFAKGGALLLLVVGVVIVLLLLLFGVAILFLLRTDGHGGSSSKYGRGFREDKELDVPPARDSSSGSSVSGAESVMLEGIQRGDFVQISESVGGQSNISFRVRGVNRYETEQSGWSEYYGGHLGRTVCLEVVPGLEDQVGVVFSDRTLRLDQVGLTEDDLVNWDEGKAACEYFEFDGELWDFEWSGETWCHAADSSTQDSYYGWDFVGRGSGRTLCVEKREEYPFEVCLVHMIDRERIRVTRD